MSMLSYLLQVEVQENDSKIAYLKFLMMLKIHNKTADSTR